MTDIITGPGEYRTRDGMGAIIEIVKNGFAYGFYPRDSKGFYIGWFLNGVTEPHCSQANIIGPWVDEKLAEPECQGFEPFWMVIGADEVPILQYRHDSYAKAAGEAQRLAHENPGVKFYVLKAVSVAEGNVTVAVSNVKGGE
jgi:hypothetical protein